MKKKEVKKLRLSRETLKDLKGLDSIKAVGATAVLDSDLCDGGGGSCDTATPRPCCGIY